MYYKGTEYYSAIHKELRLSQLAFTTEGFKYHSRQSAPNYVADEYYNYRSKQYWLKPMESERKQGVDTLMAGKLKQRVTTRPLFSNVKCCSIASIEYC